MDELYDEAFYAERIPLRPEYEAMADVLMANFQPKAVVDFGCGPGEIINRLAEHGAVVLGYDSSPFARDLNPFVVTQDVTDPSLLESPGGTLVLCLETAEHIRPDKADALIANVAASTSKWLVWSAATPGQGGTGHVNEQPMAHWQAKLEAQGLKYMGDSSIMLRGCFAVAAPRQPWYGRTTMVFGR